MEIIYTEYDNELRIMPIGELDETSAENARSSIDNVLSDGRHKKVIINLSKLSFMDSTGIGVIVGRFKKFARNISFFIEEPTMAINKLLTLSGIYTIMPRIK